MKTLTFQKRRTWGEYLKPAEWSSWQKLKRKTKSAESKKTIAEKIH